MRVYELQAFGLENLKIAERPRPEPGPGQALVRMRACSLNFRDLMIAKGLYNPKMRLPMVPFSDGCGVVEAVGSGVTRVKPGDRVTPIFMQTWIEGDLTDAKGKSALGGGTPVGGVLAEYAVLSEHGLVPVPDGLSDEQASCLPCAAVTAWTALVTQGHLKSGDTVLVQGTGGVSIFALQFAKAHGARVIATSSSDDKLARVKQLGADETINYKTTPDWDKAAVQLTGGVGVDHVVEVGGAGTFERSLHAIRPMGTVSQIGVLTGVTRDLNIAPILMKHARVQGIYVGSRAMFEDMNRAIVQNKIVPVVDKVFSFDQAPDALRHMESGGHFGKIVVRIA
jgi:NADPH:quinone reductase-like Zn-dependent oxidoreductase